MSKPEGNSSLDKSSAAASAEEEIRANISTIMMRMSNSPPLDCQRNASIARLARSCKPPGLRQWERQPIRRRPDSGCVILTHGKFLRRNSNERNNETNEYEVADTPV